MKIIPYSSARSKEITELFYTAVHHIDDAIYSQQQKEAWAPLPIDYLKWYERLTIKKPYMALLNKQVVGFIELEHDIIDCAYVHPEHQGKGIGSALVNHVTSLAEKSDVTILSVNASIIAKPLFEKLGFLIESKNEVIRNNVLLTNYTMSLSLFGKSDGK